MNKLNLNNGIKFSCQSSGNCCVSRGNHGYVYLSKDDLNKLANFFNQNKNEFKKKYCKITNGFIHLKEFKKNKGNCLFLIKNRCSVYRARPIQCRTWPFWNENMNAKTWNKEIALFCPGVGKGKIYTKENILKILEKDKKNEKSILENNTNLIKNEN